jgi:putative addiction module killer protein
VTHLRQIMLEELERRNYAPGTIRSYIRTVEQFAQHFRCSPDKLGLDHIRQYQAEMFRTWKLAPNTVTQRLAALRFLYIQVLKRGWSAAETPYPKKVLHLPEILSQQEVARLIDATETPFQRILVMTLYAMVLDSTPLPELPPQLGQHPRQHLRTSGEPLREHFLANNNLDVIIVLMIVVREYIDEAGRNPFGMWFAHLDSTAAVRVTVALERIAQGHRSALKGVGEGVLEYKIDFGPGYRIYFGKDGDRLVILVGGGTKKRQDKDIAEAKEVWKDYKRRKRQGE